MISAIFRLAVLFGAVAFIQDFAPAGSVQTGLAQTGPAQPRPSQPVLKGFPFTNESLAYTVNWPSGLSLGEGNLSATSDTTGWRFELAMDASIPGFSVRDTYRSTATANLCSESLVKKSVHGSRKSDETVTIDRQASVATRRSNTGGDAPGISKATVPDCIHDALTYLFYARRELGQGRVPPAQEMIFGAIYNVSLEYAGAETITVGGKPDLTDKMICHVKGPASDIRFEAYFDRDPARTPVWIRVPLPIGKFSLELVR